MQRKGKGHGRHHGTLLARHDSLKVCLKAHSLMSSYAVGFCMIPMRHMPIRILPLVLCSGSFGAIAIDGGAV